MIDGRVVLVTGAAEGLAGALALGLEDLGATTALASGPLDSRIDAVASLASAAGTIGRVPDAVVHAAVDPAALETCVLEDTDAQAWAARCESVLCRALWCSQAAHDLLRPSGGALVFVTPTIGMTGARGLVPYASAIEGIRSLSKSAARQWGADGITVNCVAPPVETVLPGSAARTEPTIGTAALGRMPEGRTDVAAAVALLISDRARATTGTTLVADGGVVMAP